MDARDAAQRIADVLNEVRAAGFGVEHVDWPPSLEVFREGSAEPLNIVDRDDVWVVERQ